MRVFDEQTYQCAYQVTNMSDYIQYTDGRDTGTVCSQLYKYRKFVTCLRSVNREKTAER